MRMLHKPDKNEIGTQLKAINNFETLTYYFL